MDPSCYKNFGIGGLQYHYFYHQAQSSSSPTLLFLHGFPSTSDHWVHQAVYFSNKGYGVIAPDLLGYGGTSKPTDIKEYDGMAFATHCLGILDAEGIQKAVVISHDWGCKVGSRLANLCPERHLASVFISLPYTTPDPNAKGETSIKLAKEKLGRDLLSYWRFFASEEGPGIISEHEESFYSIIFTSEPALWQTHFAPEGTLRKWLLEDKRAPVAAWAPDKEKHFKYFKAGGWRAPTNWYKGMMEGSLNANETSIPEERYKLIHPVLQICTLQDTVCLPDLTKRATSAWCTNATVRDIDAGHWVMLEKPNELNAAIDEFVAGL